MNNIKLKAFVQTVGLCAIVAIAATLIVYLTGIIGPQIMTWILISALFAVGFYFVYSVNLSRLQLEKKYSSNE